MTSPYGTISSAEAVLENRDLLLLIFPWIPAKSLAQLRTVCRTWRALISDPEFAASHTQLHLPTKPSAFFLRRSYFQYDFISLSEPTSSSALFDSVLLPFSKIHISCNGLLLLSVHPLYYVLNPITNKLATIPSPFPSGRLQSAFLGISLAFDPRRSLYYKVVGILPTHEVKRQYRIHVYSSESREWRVASTPFEASYNMLFREGAFCNGAIHWIDYNGGGFRFDIDQQCLIPMPPLTNWAYDSRDTLRESNGRLQLAGTFNDCFRVLEMQRDYSQWFFKHQIHLGQLASSSSAALLHAKVVFYVDGSNHDEEGLSLVLDVLGKLIAYDLRDGTFRVIGVDRKCEWLKFDDDDVPLWIDAHSYMESLACV